MHRPRIRPLLFVLAALVIVAGVACTAVLRSAFAPGFASQPAAVSDSLSLKARTANSVAPAAPPAAADARAAGGASAVAQAPALAASAPATVPASGPSLEVEAQSVQPLDRMVIRTGQLAIEVTNIEQALATVRQIAQSGGGFVSSSNTRVEKINDQDRTVADLTIQVRSEVADSTLSALRALGKVTTEASGSQDVTEEFVDLDSNLRNLQASETAIVKLMDKATRIEDILALQRELTNVRGQIERIQGRQRFLRTRSEMSTISVSLRTPVTEGARPVLGGAWDPAAVALRGWQASLAVLRTVAEVVIVVLAFSWWIVPLLGLAGYVWLQRRRPRVDATTA